MSLKSVVLLIYFDLEQDALIEGYTVLFTLIAAI